MDSLEVGRGGHGKPSTRGPGRSPGKPDRSQVGRVQVPRKPKKRGRPTKPDKLVKRPEARQPTVYAYGYQDNEWQDGGVRGRILICGKPGSGKSYLLEKRIRGCRRVVLFNTASVDSFDKLPALRIATPGELKARMLESYRDDPMRVVYTPVAGDKQEHFDYVCRIIKACGHCVFAVDEIDTFMSASDPGCESFYDLCNYGRHARVAMIGTTRNTVAVSRQFTSMLTELDVFATTEPRYLRYIEDTCGAAVSDQVPLLGKHEYLRWIADGGTCERGEGWNDGRRRL